MKKSILLLATILAFTITNAQQKTSMKVEELQKAITKHIKKNYVGYKTIEAYKVDTKGIISYEVIVEKTTNKLDLYYDNDGKFLRKEVEKKTKTVPKTNKTNKSDTTKQDTLKKQ